MTDMTDLDALERELPSLTRLRRFAMALEHIPWFSALGEPLEGEARRDAETYVNALGFPDADIAILVDWEDTAAAAETLDWANPAWEAEELIRMDVTHQALELVSEEALQLAMTMIAEKAGEAAKYQMEDQAAIWDVSEESVRNLAVGSAVQACHNAALTLLAAAADPEFDGDNHAFAAKLRLFEAGRWPVGVMGQSFNIF